MDGCNIIILTFMSVSVAFVLQHLLIMDINNLLFAWNKHSELETISTSLRQSSQVTTVATMFEIRETVK